MAELLGIITGCITLVDATTKTCMVARMYIHSNRAVAEELTGLLGKFASYKGLVEIIRQQVELDKDDTDRLSAIAWVSQPLEWSRRAIEGLDVRLASLPKNEKLGRIFFGKVIDKQTGAHLKAFDETLPLLQLALQYDQRVIGANTLEHAKRIRRDLSDIKDLALEQRDKQDADEKARATEQLKDWLTTIDPTLTHHSSYHENARGSGRWFLDSAFRAWIEEEPSSRKNILWLCGRSGMGKTTLLSLAIKYLKNGIGLQHGDTVAYFYCSSSAKDSQSAEAMLRSYIRQLCDQILGAEEIVRPLYQDFISTPVHERKQPSLSTLQDTFKRICALAGKVVLFLDAINEGDSKPLMDVISWCISQVPNCQMMVSSTEALDPSRALKDPTVVLVQMDQASVDEDISRYASDKLAREDVFRHVSEVLRESIQRKLELEAKGSFRWAQCQIQSLNTAKSMREVKNALASMSPTLEDHYLRTLKSVPKEYASYVRAALFWLRFSWRPMKIEELDEAMTLDTSSTENDERLFPGVAESVVRACGSLISYNAQSRSVQLAHDSVKTFLLSKQPAGSGVDEYFQDQDMDISFLSCVALDYISLPCFSLDESLSPTEASEKWQDKPLFAYVSVGLEVLLRWNESEYEERIFTGFSSPQFKRNSHACAQARVYERLPDITAEFSRHKFLDGESSLQQNDLRCR
ncbi:uncharacterized protein BKA78DRAFT_301187 [Phyllosticta capitalensis]|uniref:uncharacterized protein n=1 Tax=Phyllosticta capitalensis TaxID=121624 RepID=UPI003131320C